MRKNIINDNQVKIIENMNNERMVNMNIQMLNSQTDRGFERC